VHAIAHPVGSWFNTHHGLTNAVILPYVMTFNRGAIADKSAVIARVLDLPAHSYEGFFDWVLEMRRDLGIPHSLAGIGVSADMADIIGREAAIDPSAGGNPIPVDAAQRRAFSGPRSPEISRRWMAPGDGPSNPDHRRQRRPDSRAASRCARL